MMQKGDVKLIIHKVVNNGVRFFILNALQAILMLHAAFVKRIVQKISEMMDFFVQSLALMEEELVILGLLEINLLI